MWRATRLALLAILAAIAFWPDLAAAAPEIGWWWNPNESGRGFFVESHDGVFFLGAYLYADDGHATWLVSGGANADPYNYSGRLLAVANGQTLFGSYVAPSPSTDAGAVTVTFSDDTHGTITWPGGTIPIVRDIFGAGTADFQPFNGWWWNAAESGSGYSVELQGNSLFIVGFMYEPDGRPVWYFSAGPMSSPTTFSSKLLQFANGQTMTGPYRAPSAPVTVGTLGVEFLGLDEAIFTIDETTASPAGRKFAQKGGRTRVLNVKPQFTKCIPTRKTWPDRYDGNFSETIDFHDTSNPFLDVHETITITGNLTFEDLLLVPPVNPYRDQCGKPLDYERYYPTAGQITVTYNYASTTLIAGGPSCTQSNVGGTTFAYPLDIGDTHLDVRADSRYLLALNVPEGNLKITVTGSCTLPTVPPTTVPLAPEDVSIVIDFGINEGADVYGFHGDRRRTVGEQVTTFHWSFAAVHP